MSPGMAVRYTTAATTAIRLAHARCLQGSSGAGSGLLQRDELEPSEGARLEAGDPRQVFPECKQSGI